MSEAQECCEEHQHPHHQETLQPGTPAVISFDRSSGTPSSNMEKPAQPDSLTMSHPEEHSEKPYPQQQQQQQELQPGTPAIIPTVTPSGTPSFSPGEFWENQSIRHAFIRKVYLILAAQLLFTTSIIAVFTFVDPVRLFIMQYPVVFRLSFAVFFAVYSGLVCCETVRRQFPANLVLLFIFTLAMSYMTGAISSYYETKAMFLAMGITAVVDFTSCTGLFCGLAIVLLITGIIATIVLSFQYIPWLHMLYAALGAIIYTLLLAFSTQLLLGNRSLSLSLEEYVFGALTIYTDIIMIFHFLLQITGIRNK